MSCYNLRSVTIRVQSQLELSQFLCQSDFCKTKLQFFYWVNSVLGPQKLKSNDFGLTFFLILFFVDTSFFLLYIYVGQNFPPTSRNSVSYVWGILHSTEKNKGRHGTDPWPIESEKLTIADINCCNVLAKCLFLYTVTMFSTVTVVDYCGLCLFLSVCETVSQSPPEWVTSWS